MAKIKLKFCNIAKSVGFLALITSSVSAATISNDFVRLAKGVPGVIYSPPVQSDKSHIAILVMHSDADYLNFSMCEEMALRGFSVLCANVHDPSAPLDDKLLDVHHAIEFLRKQPNIEKVVLMGHSGGGTLMSAYQNIAENGPSVCQDSHKIVPCSAKLEGLPPADGLMLLDSNWGISAMMLFSIDPAVVDENSGQELSPALNLFNPKNGFQPEESDFPDGFISRFQKAQGERNNRIVDSALKRLKLIEQDKGLYKDNEPFIVPGAAQGFMNNKLFAQDTKLMSHTQKAWPLIHSNGSSTTQLIHSVRSPANPVSYTDSYQEGTLVTTVKSFLANYAVRTTDTYHYDATHVIGIDWNSSYNTPIGNIGGVKAPTLVMGMTGNWEYLASETIYNTSSAKDKSLAFVEGASHLFTTATDSEKYPGQFGDTLKLTYDYVAEWLTQPHRFIN